MDDDRLALKADRAAERARRKAMRPWYTKKRFIVPLGLLLILIIASIGAATEEEPDKVGTADDVERSEEMTTTSPGATGAPDTTTPATPTTPIENRTFAVGDNVRRGDLEIAVLRVNPNYTPSNEFIRPRAGKKLVGVELQVKNNGSDSEAISTLLQMKLKDSTNAQYDVSIRGGGEPQFPDGELAPGDTVRGWIGFEVPTAASGLRFIFDAEVFGGGQIFWSLGV